MLNFSISAWYIHLIMFWYLCLIKFLQSAIYINILCVHNYSTIQNNNLQVYNDFYIIVCISPKYKMWSIDDDRQLPDHKEETNGPACNNNIIQGERYVTDNLRLQPCFDLVNVILLVTWSKLTSCCSFSCSSHTSLLIIPQLFEIASD